MRPHFPFKRLSGSVFCIKAHAAVGCWQTEGTKDHDKADHTLLSWRHWMCLSIGDGRNSGPPFAHLICAFSVVFLSVILYIIHGSRSSIVQLWKLQNHETKNWISDFYIVLIDFLRILFVRVVDFVLRRSTMVNHWLEQRKSFSFHFVSYLAGFPAGDIFRLVLLSRWKIPAYGWFLPLILSGIAAFPLCRKLNMAAYCIIAMIVLPVIDFLAFHKAERRKARIADSKDIKWIYLNKRGMKSFNYIRNTYRFARSWAASEFRAVPFTIFSNSTGCTSVPTARWQLHFVRSPAWNLR